MKVAINGFGRIGRLVFRIMDQDDDFDIVAINNPSGTETAAYLLKYDSTFGRYKEKEISFDEENLYVSGKKIKVLSEREPENLPWEELDIDIVLECSGHFNSLEESSKHLKAGAKKVVVSAPCKGELKTIVYGVNEETLDKDDKVISTASCTTNCLAFVLKIIDDKFGINKGYMTTVHAITNDQMLLDSSHKKGIRERRGRSYNNIIPTSTGAASAIGKVLPELEGKLKGSAIRVPVQDGSLVELILELKSDTSKEEINKTFESYNGDLLKTTYDPVVSSDVIGMTHSSLVDLSLTEVNGNLAKVVAWYDNEYGYSYQMIRVCKYINNLKDDNIFL